MSIRFDILGAAGRDNALIVTLDSGQIVDRLLFDCGAGCLDQVAFREIRAIDDLLFSHLHMDHVAGFDAFFRCNFDRTARANRIWGPRGTAEVMHHRFRGYSWNLNAEMCGTWHVSTIDECGVHRSRFELHEAFETAHDRTFHEAGVTIIDRPTYHVDAVVMDHGTPSLAYVVREKARRNVDPHRLASLGLRPGPWLGQVTQPSNDRDTIEVDGKTFEVGALREEIIVETPGDSIAYLTDFVADEAGRARLLPVLRGCRTLVCEAQYRHDDLELATRNFHLTSVQAAAIARDAGADDLVLFHLSDRYTSEEWVAMLAEARRVFAGTRYPEHWSLGVEAT